MLNRDCLLGSSSVAVPIFNWGCLSLFNVCAFESLSEVCEKRLGSSLLSHPSILPFSPASIAPNFPLVSVPENLCFFHSDSRPCCLSHRDLWSHSLLPWGTRYSPLVCLFLFTFLCYQRDVCSVSKSLLFSA